MFKKIKKNVKVLFTLSLMFSATSQAVTLSDYCSQRVEKIAKHLEYVIKNHNKPEGITDGTFDFLLGSTDDSAEMLALSCQGMKLIELDKNPLGFLKSEKRKNEEAQAVFDKVMQEYSKKKAQIYLIHGVER